MKLLVLGNSDTAGLHIGEDPWTRVAANRLSEHLGQPVDLEEVRFTVDTPTAPAYGEKKVRDARPDLIILPVGTFQFTVGFVWVRVRNLFGERAGNWYRRLELGFDDKTLRRGRLRDALNQTIRKVSRVVPGTAPLRTRQQLTDDYVAVLHALSRVEDAQVACVTYPGRSRFTRQGKHTADRQRFLADVEAVARAHHFAWVTSKEAFDSAVGELNTSSRDGYHLNEAGHRVLGAHLASEILKSGLIAPGTASQSPSGASH